MEIKELTSRIGSSDIPDILEQLSVPYKEKYEKGEPRSIDRVNRLPCLASRRLELSCSCSSSLCVVCCSWVSRTTRPAGASLVCDPIACLIETLFPLQARGSSVWSHADAGRGQRPARTGGRLRPRSGDRGP